MGRTSVGSERIRALLNTLQGDGRGWILVTFTLGWLLVLGTRFVVPALLPQIKTDFGINNTDAGVAITLIWLAYSSMQFPAGLLADRFGERVLLLLSLLLGAFSLALFSVVPAFVLFVGVGILFGLGTGLFGTPREMVISNVFEKHDSTAFGIMIAGGTIGSALVPFAATLLVAHMEWRLTLLVFAPGFLIIAVGVWRFSPHRSTEVTRESSRASFTVIRREATRIRVFAPMIAASIILFVYQGLTSFLPVYLITVKATPQSTAGGLFALFFATAAFAQPTAGGIADRYGRRRVLVLLAAWGVIPLLAVPFVSGLVPLTVVLILAGIQLGTMPVNNAYIARALPDEVQGTVWGLFRWAMFSIGALGSTVIGSLADFNYFNESFFVLAGLTGIAAIIYFFSMPVDRT